MPKITLTYEFSDLADFQAYMDGIGTDRADLIASTEADVVIASADRAPPEPEITDSIDRDGLPYDPEIHATPKSQTSDGLWRAKRGKSKDADAARAAFKASGGAVAAPFAIVPTLPGMPLPVLQAVRAAAPEPITYEKLIDKTVGMMSRGRVTSERVIELYAEIGLTDPAVLETNESMRAALYGKLAEIEPDLA